MILVSVLYALFALVFVIEKEALQYAQPLFLVGIRMLTAGVVLLGVWRWQSGAWPKLNSSMWKRIVLLAFCNIYINNAAEFWGLQYLTSFKTCFIYSLSPFISALFSYFVYREVLSNRKWLGLVVGFLGFLPVLLSQTDSEEISGQFLLFSWAELAIVVACASSVYGWIVLKQLVFDDGVPPLVANGFSMVIGGVLALSHSRVVETWAPLPVTSLMPFVLTTLALIAISNCAAYNLYGFLLKRFSATFMSFAGLMTPLFTALFAWLALGEVATAPFWFSYLIVFTGLYLFYQEELRIEPVLQRVQVKEPREVSA